MDSGGAPRIEDVTPVAQCARWTAVRCRDGPKPMARLYPASYSGWSGACRELFDATSGRADPTPHTPARRQPSAALAAWISSSHS
jgi:hypothetical protein